MAVAASTRDRYEVLAGRVKPARASSRTPAEQRAQRLVAVQLFLARCLVAGPGRRPADRHRGGQRRARGVARRGVLRELAARRRRGRRRRVPRRLLRALSQPLHRGARRAQVVGDAASQ